MEQFSLVALVDEGRVLVQESEGEWSLPSAAHLPHACDALEIAHPTAFDPRRGWYDYSVRGTRDVTGAHPLTTRGTWLAPDELARHDLSADTARVLPQIAAFAGHREPITQQRFAGVMLVDPHGRLLLQERDEHPAIDPEKWGLAGGHVEPGESFEAAAYRELVEETGIVAAPGSLRLWGELVVDHRDAHGRWDLVQVFLAGTHLTDDDIDCHEGRQIVFVEPERAVELPLTHSAAQFIPEFLVSSDHRFLATAKYGLSGAQKVSAP